MILHCPKCSKIAFKDFSVREGEMGARCPHCGEDLVVRAHMEVVVDIAAGLQKNQYVAGKKIESMV